MCRLIVQYYHNVLYRSPLEFITLFLHFPLISLSLKSGGVKIFFTFPGSRECLKIFSFHIIRTNRNKIKTILKFPKYQCIYMECKFVCRINSKTSDLRRLITRIRTRCVL